MKVWTLGKFEELNLGQKVLVARCGGGHSIFGEFAEFIRMTEKHLVFKTDSGSIIKTDMNINTIGKAKKENYFVSLAIEGRENLIHSRVSYWNDKKLCMEYK